MHGLADLHTRKINQVTRTGNLLSQSLLRQTCELRFYYLNFYNEGTVDWRKFRARDEYRSRVVKIGYDLDASLLEWESLEHKRTHFSSEEKDSHQDGKSVTI